MLAAGDPAPDFRLADVQGQAFSLPDALGSGRSVLVAFFKIDCPVCQLTLPFLDRLNGNGSVEVVGISQNGPEGTVEFAQEFGVTFPLLLDGEDLGFPVSNEFGISNVPSLFLIGPAGRVSKAWTGWSKVEMEALGRMTGAAVIRSGDRVPEWKAG